VVPWNVAVVKSGGSAYELANGAPVHVLHLVCHGGTVGSKSAVYGLRLRAADGGDANERLSKGDGTVSASDDGLARAQARAHAPARARACAREPERAPARALFSAVVRQR